MPTAYYPFTLNRILEAKRALGFPLFQAEYDLNLVGIRSNDLQANTFNDWFIAFHYRPSGVWAAYGFQATTDPGLYHRQNPENVSGVAMVVPGHYPALWKLGLHQGKYPALVQNAPVKVYRDNDRDTLLEPDPAKIQDGLFGINCHHAKLDGTSAQVDKWSAGCQVFADYDDFQFLLGLAKRQVEAGRGATFSYSLILESQIK